MSDEPNRVVDQGQPRNRGGVVDAVQSKAQEILCVPLRYPSASGKYLLSRSQEDYQQARGLVGDAAKSRAYLYPIKVRTDLHQTRLDMC